MADTFVYITGRGSLDGPAPKFLSIVGGHDNRVPIGQPVVNDEEIKLFVNHDNASGRTWILVLTDKYEFAGDLRAGGSRVTLLSDNVMKMEMTDKVSDEKLMINMTVDEKVMIDMLCLFIIKDTEICEEALCDSLARPVDFEEIKKIIKDRNMKVFTKEVRNFDPALIRPDTNPSSPVDYLALGRSLHDPAIEPEKRDELLFKANEKAKQDKAQLEYLMNKDKIHDEDIEALQTHATITSLRLNGLEGQVAMLEVMEKGYESSKQTASTKIEEDKSKETAGENDEDENESDDNGEGEDDALMNATNAGLDIVEQFNGNRSHINEACSFLGGLVKEVTAEGANKREEVLEFH